MITRYNKKTVTVVTDVGQRWNVAPSLLRLAQDVRPSSRGGSNVIDLRTS